MAEVRGYRHLCEIASGGMGRVYVAVRRGDPTKTLYAVKRLHPHLREDPRARRTLTSETRLAGNVDHANVLEVIESGEDEHGPFLAMQYVEGCSLAELFSKVKRMDEEFPLQICLEVIRQIALGLHAIHEQVGGLLVVHRDVSPQNVLVDFAGVVRIADFGIAKPLNPIDEHSGDTSTGVLKGKVGYMSPEQLRFEQPDRRADLFALGVVLWELLAGRRLYHGSDGTEGARRILKEPPPDIADEREDTPAEIVQLLFELLAKTPDARPPSADVVASRLHLANEGLAETEGHIHLGDYTRSFFEQELRARRSLIEAGLDEDTDSASVVLEEPDRPWRVKGAAIKATVEYLQMAYGEDGFARVVEICPGEIRETMEQPVLVSSWYDGQVMVALTEAAQRLFGEQERSHLALRIGVASADFAFGDGGPYEVFRRQGLRVGVKSFLETSGEIYRLYYDVGEWTVQSLDEQHAVMRIVEGSVFPRAIVDRISGYLQRGFELIGCDNVSVVAKLDDDDLLLDVRFTMARRTSWIP